MRSQPTQEVHISLAVGIDVGAYKCAMAVYHQGESEGSGGAQHRRQPLWLHQPRRVDGPAASAHRAVMMESLAITRSTWPAICAGSAIRWRW
jgi:hypothetical protein